MKTVSNLLIYKCLCNCSHICWFLQYLQLCPKFNTFKVFNPLFTFKKIYQKIKLINKHNIHLVYISKEIKMLLFLWKFQVLFAWLTGKLLVENFETEFCRSKYSKWTHERKISLTFPSCRLESFNLEINTGGERFSHSHDTWRLFLHK